MIRGLWESFYPWYFQGHPDFEDPIYYKPKADFGDVGHICGVCGGP